MIAEDDCPFCQKIKGPIEKLLFYNQDCVAFYDNYPISLGHVLIVPKKHVQNIYETMHAAQSEMADLVPTIMHRLQDKYPLITGFNVGMNIGESAGQTVEHAHIHVIPRYDEDIEDPRGGIRNIIPAKAKYWG